MAESKVKKVVRYFEGILREKGLNISKIVLFGSHTRGKASSESDIDLVIVSEDFRGKNIFERTQFIKDAETMTIKKFMIPLDIIMMTPEEFESETSIVAGYAKEGEVVFSS